MHKQVVQRGKVGPRKLITLCLPCSACSYRTSSVLFIEREHQRAKFYSTMLQDPLPTSAHAKLFALLKERQFTADIAGFRAFMDKLAVELGIQEPSDWYSISEKNLRKRGGKIIKQYASLYEALRVAYPEIRWDWSKFQRGTPHGWWNSLDNQRAWLEDVGYKLGVREKGGLALMSFYRGLPHALKVLYKDYPWQPELFAQTGRLPNNFVDDLNSQKILVENISKELGIIQLEDWYQVPVNKFKSCKGGWSLLRRHGCLATLLRAVYPSFDWQNINFKSEGHIPPGYWQDTTNLKSAFDRAERRLGIKKPEDWYSVALSDLRELGFPTIRRSRLAELLAERYPDYKWEKVYLLRGRYAQQKRLERAIETLFPGVEYKLNARKEAQLVNPETGAYLELDIFVPSLNIAFEYQERHHYTQTEGTLQPLEAYQGRDHIKIQLAQDKGITLIVVPCWWDGLEESLVATIKKVRPDLLPDITVTGKPIPDSPPEGYFEPNVNQVEDIGQPMTACFLKNVDVDPLNWWLFEKYDGVRGFWNPAKKAFFSRQGNRFPIPQHIIDTMPDNIFLDGELWFGRDAFQEALKLTSRGQEGVEVDWTNFKYMVFDTPNHTTLTFQQRFAVLEKQFGQSVHRYIELAPHEICTGIPHLEKFFQDVVDNGGEGVILRDPNAPYKPGRSAGYLKHKKFRDAEAKIVAQTSPFEWECELPNGIKFVAAAGSTEFISRWNPQPGDIVSFKHRGFLLSTKKPKLPVMYRVRKDLKWEDVLSSWTEKKPIPKLRGQPRQRVYNPKNFWKKIENRRRFFTQYAKERGFDPLVPENWKDILPTHFIESSKDACNLLRRYKGNLKEALQATFPELNFDYPAPEPNVRKYHWKDPNNCRILFDEYAKENDFDPLNSENWYNVDFDLLLEKRGAITISKLYGGLRAALKQAYPEVKFIYWEGLAQKKKTWEDPQKLRKFFEDYAKEKGFDPLIAENWSSVGGTELRKRQGGHGISLLHNGFKNALKVAYPELGNVTMKPRSTPRRQ